MKRFALFAALVCSIVLQASAPPAAAQETAQTVRAAIPPQAARPTTATVPASPAVAPQRAELAPPPKALFDAEAANVRIEVTISYQAGNAAPVRRTATLTVADQGRGSLRSGNQVAVPSTTLSPAPAPAKADGGTPAPTVPMTEFKYRSVGLNLDANRVYIQGNKAKMELSVEFSAIDEKTGEASGRLPSFPTFSQTLSLVLENGKPIIVGQSSDFVDNVERKQSVEVRGD